MLPTIEEIFVLLNKIIDTNKILANPQKILHTQQYYYWTNYFYRRFHSKKGAMHFPLFLENGAKNHFEGLETQVNTIKKHITELYATHITEIGCGQGFNTHILAKDFPNAHFTGFDLVAFQQKQASNTAKKLGLENVSFEIKDFEEDFLGKKQDVFFAIESFCYAKNPLKIFKNIYQNLKPKGRFIIFDMFLQSDFDTLPTLTQQASQLSALGYAVHYWKKMDLILSLAQEAGFKILNCQDLTYAVRPNAIRFQKDAINALKKYRIFWRYLRKLRLLPESILFHLIAGAIAPYAWQAQGYFLVELER